NFTSNVCNSGGLSADSLCNPTAVAADGSGNLYLADATNNRVLEYNSPQSTDTTADRVYGTCGSFTSHTCAGLSANSLSNPTGVAVDSSGNLYVADSMNNRVLAYDQPLAIPSPTASA